MKKPFVPCTHVDWPSGIAVSADPVRKVHTRARRRNTSLIHSTLPLGMRVAESQSEVLFLKVAQFDPGVSCIRAQPCTLRVPENGRIRRRTPDFAVMYDGEPELVEVKQDEECRDPEVRSELLAIRDEVERQPYWRYNVALESALRAEPLFTNTTLLWRAWVPPEEIELDLWLRTLDAIGDEPIAADDVIRRTCGVSTDTAMAESWDRLLAMIADRRVHYDINEPLTPATVVWTKHSGLKRARTLPFGSVDAAIKLPEFQNVDDFTPFASLPIRRRS